jgi:hypothetical protein
MGCLIVLLATALSPTGYLSASSKSPPLSVPALCLFTLEGARDAFDNLTSTYENLSPFEINQGSVPSGQFVYVQKFNSMYIALALVFLVGSYVFRILSLSPRSANKIESVLRGRLGYALKKKIFLMIPKVESSRATALQAFGRAYCVVTFTTYVLLKVIYEIGKSMLWEVCLHCPPNSGHL